MSSTCKSLAGGVSAVVDLNQLVNLTVGGAFATDDKISILLTDTLTGVQTIIGAGNVTGIAPVFVFVYNRKVYFLAGSTVYFSALDEAATFNDPNGTGNSFVTLNNIFAAAEDVVAIALQQGKLVFFSRSTTQVWVVDADPDNWQQYQVLQNCGTMAGKSVQALGELEVFFLKDSGLRSLRARETTLNAFVTDIGSPIDQLVVAKLASSSSAEKAAAISVVEPSADRYWCFLKDTIYVLSYFQSAQIIAWSTYSPTYETSAAVNPVAGVYDANGLCAFNGLVVGESYRWTKGANDGNLTCGTTVLNASGDFVATATTATVAGIIGQNYTGTLLALSQTAFTPTEFVTLDGQVFARDADALYAYGGADGNSYDSTKPQWDIPFLDVQSPAAGKRFTGIDVAMEGPWSIYVGTNPDNSDDLKLVYNNNKSSYASAVAPVMRRATHYKLRGIGRGTGYCRFSKAVQHFEPGAEK